MTDNILLQASFAAARKQLAGARHWQKLALLAAMDMYRGGARGRRARADYKLYDRRRGDVLRDALAIRRKIHQLRAMVRELESQPKEAAHAAE